LGRSQSTQVVIIGAGPYGLSLAAHLNDRKIGCRIFGRPMQMWRERMPHGMVLMTPGFASNLTAGHSSFTFADFCAEKGYAYDATGIPVKLEHFTEYGIEFQKRLVPQLEELDVVAVRRVVGGFRVRLEDGGELLTSLLVVATGIGCFDSIPKVFEGLAERYVSHSSMHADLSGFASKQVTVLGAGASALDTAALLKELGADVTLIAREKAVRFEAGPPEGDRTWIERLRTPSSPMGPGWRSWMICKGPHIFRLLPEDLRHKILKNHPGPAGGWTIKRRVLGKVPMLLGVEVKQAFAHNGLVSLTLTETDGTTNEHLTEHVIAATGYEVDLSRLTFLGAGLRAEVKEFRGAPLLDTNFQSSVKGLYFIGEASAQTFGPLMRFACGAHYSSAWLSWHLAWMSRSKVRKATISEMQLVDR
jgi:thioredoxin reductase